MSRGSRSWTPSAWRFPDSSFDVIVAQLVVTTVPNPEATLDEFLRVLKPGGEIVLVSRVGADKGPRRVVEKWLTPITQFARLAPGIPLGALCALGRAAKGGARDRTQRHAALRSFLAHPLWQDRRTCRCHARGAFGGACHRLETRFAHGADDNGWTCVEERQFPGHWKALGNMNDNPLVN